MSAIQESFRKQRTPLLAIAIAIVLGAGAWLVISQTTAEHLTNPEYPTAAPAIEQAAWKVDYSDSGRVTGLSNKEKARYSLQRDRVGDVVTDIYDGIFLNPAQLDDLIKRFFSSDAASSIGKAKLGLPAGASEVTTTKRKAKIGLDASTADFAIAKVLIVADAKADDREVTIEHSSTLWLERSDNDWKVIAFDLEQGPTK